jgi:hypothetical protein
MRIMSVVWLLATATWAAPSVNDCTTPAWRQRAGQLFTPLATMTCQTREVRAVPELDLSLRVVQDAMAPEPEIVEWTTRVLEAGTTALKAYKSARPQVILNNVTFIVARDQVGSTVAAADRGLNDECLIVLLTRANSVATVAGRDQEVPSNVAHELVHCLQRWNAPAQMAVPQADREWWVEGSAEYLSNTVFPRPADVATRFGEFEDSTDALTRQSYGTLVFFAWYAQTRGPAAVFALWSKLPTTPGESNQRAALLSEVKVDGLRLFAEGFVAGTIASPAGGLLPAPMLTPMTFFGDATRMVSADGFSVLRGELVFQEGRYALATTSSSMPPPRFLLDGAWTEAITVADSACIQNARIKFAGFPTGSSQALSVTAKRVDASQPGLTCEPMMCVSLGKNDSCLSGAWQLDEDRTTANINAVIGDPNPTAGISGDITLTLEGAGAASITYSDYDLLVGTNRTEALLNINITGAMQGSWSTATDGSLRLCSTSNTVEIKTSAQVFDGKANPKTEVMLKKEALAEMTYACVGNMLTLRGKLPKSNDTAPLEWVFKRKGTSGGGCSSAPSLAFLAVVAFWFRRPRASKVALRDSTRV